jgi:hypothetical protein
MKKPVLLPAIAFLTFLPPGARAQNADSACYHNSDARNISKKATSLSGEISSNDETLMADRDRRIWKVSNP